MPTLTAIPPVGSVASRLNIVSMRNAPNTTVALRMNNLAGNAAEGKRRAYGADGKLQPVASELWTITDENGRTAETLENGTLYELRVTVADNGALDLNETAKEIKVSVILGK